MDFLDEVCSFSPTSSQLTKFTVQILGVAQITDEILQQCLLKLRTICINHGILPSSYIITNDLARVGEDPVAFGDFSNVWEGIYNGSKVCIKCLRVSEQTRQAIEKVGI